MTSRISDAGATATMLYGSENGGATAGHGYWPVPGSLSFAPGETGRTIRVATIDGLVDEDPETVIVRLDGVANAELADGAGTGTISNDDPMPGAWLSRFARVEDGMSIDGVVTGATVRVDAARDGLLASVAFAHNRGERGVRLIGDRQPEPGPRLAVWSVLASAAAG